MCKIVSDKREERFKNIYLGLIEQKKTAIYGNVALVSRLIDDMPTTFYDLGFSFNSEGPQYQ